MEKKGNPIRVLHIVSPMGYGGAETLVMSIFRESSPNEILFSFLCQGKKSGRFDKEILSKGATIYRLPYFKGTNFFRCCHDYDAFFKEHQKDFDIVHCHVETNSFIVLKYAKKYGLKTIAHSHNSKYGKFPVAKWFLYKMALPYADAFLACSKEAAVNRFGGKIAKNKSTTLINGIQVKDYEFTNQKREQARLLLPLVDKNSIVIGTVGRNVKQKNQTFLIDVFAIFVRKYPTACLVIVGDGPLHQKLYSKTCNLGLTSNVLFLGNRGDVPLLLSGFDIFCLPSLYEGFGISAIEAEVSGLPCLLSDRIPEIAKKGTNVSTVPTKSALEWAATLDSIVCNLPICSRKVDDGILDFYSCKNTYLKYLHICQSLCSKEDSKK
jgi:glycosyltransferase involved in cell wall biosynthesis